MWEVTEKFTVRLGGITFTNLPHLVICRGQSLFTLQRHDENGLLAISFPIYDAQGRRVASVKENRIYFGNKANYQIDGTAMRYTLTEKATGRVICDIRRCESAEPAELVVAVTLYSLSGTLFEATPEYTNIRQSGGGAGFTLKGVTIENCGGAGIVVP